MNHHVRVSILCLLVSLLGCGHSRRVQRKNSCKQTINVFWEEGEIPWNYRELGIVRVRGNNRRALRKLVKLACNLYVKQHPDAILVEDYNTRMLEGIVITRILSREKRRR